MRAALALVVLAGCALEPPPDPYNTEVPVPAALERAEGIVRAQWSARLEFDLPDDVPEVRYFDGCLIYPDDYMRQEWYSGCIEGRYWHSGPVVHVRRLGDGPADDALAHELLHWSLDVARGDSDGGHLDPLWREVPEVKGALTLDALCMAKYDRSTCDGIALPSPDEVGP